jgi:hypothetical protein
LRFDAAVWKLFSIWLLMYAGDSLSVFVAGLLSLLPVLPTKVREVVESNRDLEV